MKKNKPPTKTKTLPAHDLKAILDVIPDPYMVLDTEYNILAVNQAFLDVAMVKKENILGKNVFSVFPENPRTKNSNSIANFKNSIKKVMRSKKPDTMAIQKYDLRLPEEKGGEFAERYWSPSNTPVLDEEKNVKYIIHRVNDVTEFVSMKKSRQDQAQESDKMRLRYGQLEVEVFMHALEIQEANKQLLEANKQLAKKENQQKVLNKKLEKFNASKAQFFANVSHELRAPLTLILGIIEGFLLDHNLSAHQANFKIVERNTRQVLNLVNDLVDVAKLEAGKGSIKYYRIDLAKLVKQTAALFESYAIVHKVKLVIKTPPTLVVELDPEKIQRILLNLLANAFKFTPVDGTVECILYALDQNTARIIIADGGPGISPKMRETIFERFFYVESEANRKFSSIGLGLAMVKDFVELHGGSISLNDEPRGGAVFTIDLPLFSPAGTIIHLELEIDNIYNSETAPIFVTKPRQSKSAERDRLAAANLNLPLVLIVEDNIDVNQYIVGILKSGFRTESAYDGAEALQKVIDLHPDIVLTDLLMPKMDGIQLIHKIREHEASRETPIIVISAKVDEELCVKLLSAGAQDYLAKPFSRAELKARVTNLTTLKKTKDELEKKNLELTIANRELDAFGYSVSHDLRNPLHAVIGFSSLLLDDKKLDDQSTEYLQNILIASKRMEELINDLLALSYAIRREIIFETVNLSKMAKEIMHALQEQEPERKVKVHIKDNIIASCDGHLVKIALENLLRNAWKYSSKKAETEIEFGVIDLPEPIYYVRDNGVGFPLQKADKLFMPFSRLHSEKEFPGTGIGLAIVKRIIERHGGRVSVESEEGKGAIFYMTLAREKGKIPKG